MTLTVRVLGLELLMLDITTDAPAETGYDHDVATTSVEGEPCGDVGDGVHAGVGGRVTDYRTLAIVDALTSLGIELLPWQVEALDRMMLASSEEEDDG